MSKGEDIVSQATEKSLQAVNKVQSGLSSVFGRLSSGESTPLEVIKEGVNTSSNNAKNLYGKFFEGTSSEVDFGQEAFESLTSMGNLYRLDNDVFRTLALTGGLLGAKLILNSGFTTINRVQRKVFSSQEDVAAFGGTSTNTNDSVVERIRRMHLNDIENFTPFMIMANLYVATEPSTTEMNCICGLFLAARAGHSISYIALKKQPWRFYFFMGGAAVNSYLALRLLHAVLFK